MGDVNFFKFSRNVHSCSIGHIRCIYGLFSFRIYKRKQRHMAMDRIVDSSSEESPTLVGRVPITTSQHQKESSNEQCSMSERSSPVDDTESSDCQVLNRRDSRKSAISKLLIARQSAEERAHKAVLTRAQRAPRAAVIEDDSEEEHNGDNNDTEPERQMSVRDGKRRRSGQFVVGGQGCCSSGTGSDGTLVVVVMVEITDRSIAVFEDSLK